MAACLESDGWSIMSLFWAFGGKNEILRIFIANFPAKGAFNQGYDFTSSGVWRKYFKAGSSGNSTGLRWVGYPFKRYVANHVQQ